MFTFFFLIVFIAEVIITWHIAVFILKCDRKVCEINKTFFSGVRPAVLKGMLDFRISVNNLLLTENKVLIKLRQKKEQYKWVIIKNIVTTSLYFILKADYKKILAGFELFLSAKDNLGTILKSRI